jgi:hypothetical protein
VLAFTWEMPNHLFPRLPRAARKYTHCPPVAQIHALRGNGSTGHWLSIGGRGKPHSPSEDVDPLSDSDAPASGPQHSASPGTQQAYRFVDGLEAVDNPLGLGIPVRIARRRHRPLRRPAPGAQEGGKCSLRPYRGLKYGAGCVGCSGEARHGYLENPSPSLCESAADASSQCERARSYPCIAHACRKT